jgi:predicted nucleic acid-binding protein
MAETESSFILLDYTVLSIFAAVLAMDLLGSLYNGRAFVSQTVWHELKLAMDNNWQDTLLMLPSPSIFQAIERSLEVGWLQFPDANVNPNDDIIELRRSLAYQKRFGRGRAESLAICSNRNWIFACEEDAARCFAKRKEIRFTSSMGIIGKATKLQILNEYEAKRIYARMINVGYLVPNCSKT